MRTKGWTITGGTVIAIISGVGAWASNNTDKILEGVKTFTDFASVTYVDEKFMKLAGGLEIQGAQINSMANMMVDNRVDSLTSQLEVARATLLQTRADAAANPALPSLQMLLMAADAKVRELETNLSEAKCYRQSIISGQKADCRALP